MNTTNICPTCGRAPSERVGLNCSLVGVVQVRCLDPIHDLADRVGEMREALEHSKNALLDYIDEKEKRGDICGYGHSVLRMIDAALRTGETT